MSITMNSVHRASAAELAAKAAKADFTAPVAVHRPQERADNGAAPANTAAPAAAAKPPPGPAPARNAQPTAGAQAGKTAQGGKTTQSGKTEASEPGDAPADAPAAASFAHLLNLVDPVAAKDGAADHADHAGDSEDHSDTADRANSTTGAEALPAMMNTSMLNLGAAAVTPAADSRGDAVSAVSTLSNSATRLNLAAVSVAVNVNVNVVAPQADAAAAARAAAPPQATPGVTVQGVYNVAAQGAPARQTKADAPSAADADAAADTGTDTVAASPVPAPAADNAAAPQPAIASAVPRGLPRAVDAAPVAQAGQATDAGATLATTAGKDENRATAAAPAANNGNVGNVGLTAGAPAAPAASGATVKLAGTPEQWQQPLRQALGDRLQVNLQRNNDHAVIRLEPPNMGSIEISIRHTAGSLQVSLTANNSEVVRQLNTIGDSVRQDLSTRQFTDVAVTVSSSRAQGQAQSQPDGGGRNGQQRGQDDGRAPGRALSEDGAAALFAMTSEQE